MADERFYIASLKHTIRDHEHISFWGPEHRGYVLVVKDGHTGEYTLAEAQRLNDGQDCLAVPVKAVKELLSPEPYYRNGRGEAARFYDTPGPVVDNTRANWNRLIAAALPGRVYKPKPEVHRRVRRSFALESNADVKAPYNAARIAWELERTALGDGHYGNALRVAKDIPGLTDGDRALLDRYATGRNGGTDHVALQDLALRVGNEHGGTQPDDDHQSHRVRGEHE